MATQADPRDIILAPVISEKSYGLIEDNTYTFIVAPGSNKTEIKQAVEAIFDVKVDSVNTVNRKGKTRRTRTGTGCSCSRPDWMPESRSTSSTSRASRCRSSRRPSTRSPTSGCVDAVVTPKV